MSDSKSKKTKAYPEPGKSGFPVTSSVMPGDTKKEDAEPSPCAPGAPCSTGGGDPEDPKTGTGGGKSGLTIRPASSPDPKAGATESTEQPNSEPHEHQPGRMVMFYLETDNICIESLGMDEFFTNLAQRAKSKA